MLVDFGNDWRPFVIDYHATLKERKLLVVTVTPRTTALTAFTLWLLMLAYFAPTPAATPVRASHWVNVGDA